MTMPSLFGPDVDEEDEAQALVSVIAAHRILLGDVPPGMTDDQALHCALAGYADRPSVLLEVSLWVTHRLLRTVDESDRPVRAIDLLMDLQRESFQLEEPCS